MEQPCSPCNRPEKRRRKRTPASSPWATFRPACPFQATEDKSLGHLPPRLPFPGYRGQAWKPGPQHMLSGFSRVLVFATPWTVVRQAPHSVGFSRQESWSGLPCPPVGELPDPWITPKSLTSPALALGSLPLAPPGSQVTPTEQGWPCPALASAVI